MRDTKTTAAARLLGLAAAAIAVTAAVALLLPGGAAAQAAAEPGPAGQPAAPDAAADARAGAAAAAGPGAAADAGGDQARGPGAGTDPAGAFGGETDALRAEHEAVPAGRGSGLETPGPAGEKPGATGERLAAATTERDKQQAQIAPALAMRAPGHAPSAKHLAEPNELQARPGAGADYVTRGHGPGVAEPDPAEARASEGPAGIEAGMDAPRGRPAREGGAAPERGSATAEAESAAGHQDGHGRAELPDPVDPRCSFLGAGPRRPKLPRDAKIYIDKFSDLGDGDAKRP